MAVTFEQFFAAIAQQESGNRYSAVGPQTRYGRAYGKYQVLAPNIGPWTQQYYGKRLSAQQFLNNPQAQEAVARGKLRSYWNKYGARGAASAWYSGNPNLHMSTRAQSGGPSIKGYVDSVLRIASGINPGAAQTSAQATTYSAPETPRMTVSEQAESFGLSLRLVNSNKELKRLFDKAVAGSWSPDRFQAALRNTKWWRGQSSTLREYVTLRYTDPATWKQNRDNAYAAMKSLAARVGVKGISSGTLWDAVYNKLALGWDDARLQNWFGSKISFTHGQAWGDSAAVWDDLHDLAYQMGMKYSLSWYENATRKIASGKSTIAEHETYIRRQSAGRYAAYASQIKAGMSVQDLAAPFIEAVSRILELPETDLDAISNSHISKAMRGRDDGLPTPMWEFENSLRNDPKWRKTKNAQDSMMGVAHQVLRDFGMAY
ncbi:hypothetical protein [Streptomyces johnsoniae]|uniref:Uncharacterized protein n=1 Tax=Streptomyces johnsoniae TaxID=3075532 RepID=A0ABU2S016_9ACTN|nr:hypothetical protein [Streptomyces sp. DSM 41886]MDT0442317.1 hypothetical protein [Streptomyces sp. DSM 41886]